MESGYTLQLVLRCATTATTLNPFFFIARKTPGHFLITLTKQVTPLIMKKSERLGLGLTAAEKQAVATLAKARGGLSYSALIRCLIHEATQAAGLSLNKLVSNEQSHYGY